MAQTYEQLASYYAAQGREGDARRVRLTARRVQRRREPWLRRLPGILELVSVLGQAAGYLLTIPALAAVNRAFTRN